MVYRVFVRVAQVAIMASFLTGGAVMAGVTLGASFGYSHLSFPDFSDFTNNIVGIPGSEDWGQPGLRVGYLAPGGRWNVNADVGLVSRSGPIFDDTSAMELMTQLQWNARVDRTLTPFVDVGIGLRHDHVSGSISATRPKLGVGFGLRLPVSDDHGFVRAELRYDRLAKSEIRLNPFSTFTFLAVDMLSVKLGFDLLLTRQH